MPRLEIEGQNSHSIQFLSQGDSHSQDMLIIRFHMVLVLQSSAGTILNYFFVMNVFWHLGFVVEIKFQIISQLAITHLFR